MDEHRNGFHFPYRDRAVNVLKKLFTVPDKKWYGEQAKYLLKLFEDDDDLVVVPKRLRDVLNWGLVNTATSVNDIALVTLTKNPFPALRFISLENEKFDVTQVILEYSETGVSYEVVGIVLRGEVYEHVRAVAAEHNPAYFTSLQWSPKNVAELRSMLRPLGLTLGVKEREFRVTARAGTLKDREDIAYYTKDIDDAWGTAYVMAPQVADDPRFGTLSAA